MCGAERLGGRRNTTRAAPVNRLDIDAHSHSPRLRESGFSELKRELSLVVDFVQLGAKIVELLEFTLVSKLEGDERCVE